MRDARKPALSLLLAASLAAPAFAGPNASVGRSNAGNVGSLNGSAGAPLGGAGDTALVQPDGGGTLSLNAALTSTGWDQVSNDVLAEGLRERAPEFLRATEAARDAEAAPSAARGLSASVVGNLQGNFAGQPLHAADVALLAALNDPDPRAALRRLADRFAGDDAHRDVAGLLGQLAKSPALTRVVGHLSQFHEELARAVAAGSDEQFLVQKMDGGRGGADKGLDAVAAPVQTMRPDPISPAAGGLQAGTPDAARDAEAQFSVPALAGGIAGLPSRGPLAAFLQKAALFFNTSRPSPVAKPYWLAGIGLALAGAALIGSSPIAGTAALLGAVLALIAGVRLPAAADTDAPKAIPVRLAVLPSPGRLGTRPAAARLRQARAPEGPARWGAAHENDRAQVVVVHAPGAEVKNANFHPDSALFATAVNWQGAVAEHKNYRDALEANGVKVYQVRDVLLEGTHDESGAPLPGPKLDALRAFAGQSLKYDTRALAAELAALRREAADLAPGPVKDDVERKLGEIERRISPAAQEAYRREQLAKLSPESLVDAILNQPTIELHLLAATNHGVFQVKLDQKVQLKPLMNLYFSRDQQITTRKGVVIVKPSWEQRKPETQVMRFVFHKLGVPIIAEITRGSMEGGDFIPMGDLAFQGLGERTNEEAIHQLLEEDAYGAHEVAVVKDLLEQDKDRMHLDTVFNILGDRATIALGDILTDPKKRRTVDLYRRMPVKGLPNSVGYYVKVTEDQDFGAFLRSRGFRVATVTHEEQLAFAMNFLNVGEGHVITPFNGDRYLNMLRSLGVVPEYVPMSCLQQGDGSAHCMTQVIRRDPVRH
ncbi:MAG TPA: arginine deiminase family protein [Elusimicrobiota bacterium]|nr:arginine deiminase family protein [Elusimicrobiota bacterium]